MSTKKFQKQNSFLFSECWERIVEKTSIRYFSQLAEVVGLAKSNITKRKEENIFPVEWAFYVGMKFNLSAEWILTGEEKYFDSKQKDNAFMHEITAWINETSGKGSSDWFENQFIRCFPDFLRWREKKELRIITSSDEPEKNIA